jgi:hypothetical protein
MCDVEHSTFVHNQAFTDITQVPMVFNFHLNQRSGRQLAFVL